jgi:hypothetical protein
MNTLSKALVLAVAAMPLFGTLAYANPARDTDPSLNGAPETLWLGTHSYVINPEAPAPGLPRDRSDVPQSQGQHGHDGG